MASSFRCESCELCFTAGGLLYAPGHAYGGRTHHPCGQCGRGHYIERATPEGGRLGRLVLRDIPGDAVTRVVRELRSRLELSIPEALGVTRTLPFVLSGEGTERELQSLREAWASTGAVVAWEASRPLTLAQDRLWFADRNEYRGPLEEDEEEDAEEPAEPDPRTLIEWRESTQLVHGVPLAEVRCEACGETAALMAIDDGDEADRPCPGCKTGVTVFEACVV